MATTPPEMMTTCTVEAGFRLVRQDGKIDGKFACNYRECENDKFLGGGRGDKFVDVIAKKGEE